VASVSPECIDKVRQLEKIVAEGYKVFHKLGELEGGILHGRAPIGAARRVGSPKTR
jgi:hypothetical protein